MEYHILIIYYVLKIVKVKIFLNLLLGNMVKLIVYLIHIMKINQLDLKHLCYDRTYVIMQMLTF